MAVMMGRLYAALRDANVADEKATAAADEVAGFENRIGGLEAKVTLLTLMVGFNLVLTIALLGLALRAHS